jgi:hypothetical protein
VVDSVESKMMHGLADPKFKFIFASAEHYILMHHWNKGGVDMGPKRAV